MSDVDVLFWDDRGGFGPSFNATHLVGGAEIHLVQVAEYLAAAGMYVLANVHQDESQVENGVSYADSRQLAYRQSVDTLIIVGCASLPDIRARRRYAFQVVDPRPHPERFDHLRDNAVMVCVSQWQANLFRALGHQTTVIPVPIPDEWYGMARAPIADRFICVSSWNKGARETIDAWDNRWGELAVGSPYSHPPDAAEICARKGVTWLGTLKRQQWISALASGSAAARVCTIPETFGVVDAAARAMGMNTYTLCPGDHGALDEMGADPFTSTMTWQSSIALRLTHPSGLHDVNVFRASRVLPQWLKLIGG